MALRLSIDTTFLIDLQRERSVGDPDRPAHRFLKESPDAELFLPSVALGEFAEGFPSPENPIIRAVRDQHTILPVDEEVALIYAAVVRRLREQGRLIGSNDLWIGASSVRYGLPIVTADVEHFGRFEDLEIIAYRDASRR